MILDSLGMGELGIVVVLIVVLVEPKRFGEILRSIAKFRGKMSQMQNQVRSQINTLVLEDELRQEKNDFVAKQKRMRAWGKTQIAQLTAEQRDQGSKTLTQSLLDWPHWKEANSIAAFVGRHDEVDTEPLIRAGLAAGKTVYLPYVIPGESEAEEKAQLGFCVIRDFDHDLREGAYGILEPRAEMRPAVPGPNPSPDTLAARKADLSLIPGVCFDSSGGRIGHGMGFYDRHLAQAETFKLGVGFEAQISRNKLPLQPHDQPLDGLVSEDRLLVFAEPRRPNNPAQGGMDLGS